MLKNHKKSRVFTKALKLLQAIEFAVQKVLILYLEKLIPRSLLSRIIAYIVITLFIIVFGLMVFIYDSHWRKVREKLVAGTADNIYFTSVLLSNNYQNPKLANVIYQSFYKYNVINTPKPALKLEYQFVNPNTLSKNAYILFSLLKTNLPYEFYIKEDNTQDIKVLVVASSTLWFEFYISDNAFFISSLKSIATYSILLYLALIIVSYVFFKILTNPLRSLSKRVTEFGRGQKVKYLRPKGSLEIRTAIKSFNEMRYRINRYIEQRTLMLSSISHDLKSNLTKMSLTLELAEKNTTNDYLLEEINNMNQMITNYLTFATDEYNEEPAQTINIKQFFTAVTNQYKNNPNLNIKLDIKSLYNTISARPITLKRAINNVLDNATRVATTININVNTTLNHNYLKIIIDDNGPGIDSKNYENVFKPFFKINAARTLEKGNVGLGLSIVKDAINKHGGNIFLDKSPTQGLRVIIIIPY